MPSFHNTVNLKGKELTCAEEKAKGQEFMVIALFKKRPSVPHTPSEVYSLLLQRQRITKRTPLTSIRRAMSNLTFKGKLEQTEKMRIGPYGKPEHLWKFVKDEL